MKKKSNKSVKVTILSCEKDGPGGGGGTGSKGIFTPANKKGDAKSLKFINSSNLKS